MKEGADYKFIPMSSVDSGKVREVSPDLAYYTNQIVNLVMIGATGSDWILVDAGMPGSTDKIIDRAASRFGNNRPPKAIILTHGHFDHVGGLVGLLEKWDCPVYAHPMEFPYLTGDQAYPEPDSSVEGGMLAKISAIYPNEPIDIKDRLQSLPENGSIPFLPGWEWIHCPGHSPGQVALFRQADKALISADAIISVRQDSLYRVLVQKEEICGPPVYLTTDWEAAYRSAAALAALSPRILIPGHGTAISGEELITGLQNLINNWENEALPSHGKWVKE